MENAHAQLQITKQQQAEHCKKQNTTAPVEWEDEDQEWVECGERTCGERTYIPTCGTMCCKTQDGREARSLEWEDSTRWNTIASGTWRAHMWTVHMWRAHMNDKGNHNCVFDNQVKSQ
jgi:hypothetical protein